MRGRGGNIHEERVAPPSGVTNELHSMITDLISEVVCLVVIAMLLRHTLIRHSVAIESAKSKSLDTLVSSIIIITIQLHGDLNKYLFPCRVYHVVQPGGMCSTPTPLFLRA